MLTEDTTEANNYRRCVSSSSGNMRGRQVVVKEVGKEERMPMGSEVQKCFSIGGVSARLLSFLGRHIRFRTPCCQLSKRT
jgi:hypothetical protein